MKTLIIFLVVLVCVSCITQRELLAPEETTNEYPANQQWGD